MNKVLLMGRLTKDVDLRATTGEHPISVARYTLAIDRKKKAGEENTADFFNCVAFDKAAEFAEKYFHQGMRVLVTGRLQNSSYEKDGQKFYKTDVIVEEQEFADGKRNAEEGSTSSND